MQEGADPSICNEKGNTPLHKCTPDIAGFVNAATKKRGYVCKCNNCMELIGIMDTYLVIAGVLARSIKTTADFRIASNIQYMCKRFTIKEIQCSADVCSTILACLQLRMSAGALNLKCSFKL